VPVGSELVEEIDRRLKPVVDLMERTERKDERIAIAIVAIARIMERAGLEAAAVIGVLEVVKSHFVANVTHRHVDIPPYIS